MTRLSLRVRLVAWYLAVLTPALVVLAVGSEFLVRRSLIGTTDSALAARVDGVRLFIDNAEREQLSPEALRDEFLEWAQLTNGEVLIEVVGRSGEVFCVPQRAGWPALSSSVLAAPASIVTDQMLDGGPVRARRAEIRARDNTYQVVVAASIEQALVAMNRFRGALLFLLPAILLVAAAGGYWIAGRALAPVGRMTREVQAITVRNLDSRVEVPHSDTDLQALATTFNAMLARLQESVGDLTRLLADASHELRTPLTRLRTTAEVALSRERPAGEYREALAEIAAHAERMTKLVNDLLALARADAGVEMAEQVTCDVVEVARESLDDLKLSFAEARVDSSMSADLDAIQVGGSPESVGRLIVILLSNALRYTPPGGRVTIDITCESPDSVSINVVDTGIGIGPGDRARVFDRFYRGPDARALVSDGSGLGLAIARSIVVALGGTIDILDPQANIGSHLQLKLPRRH